MLNAYRMFPEESDDASHDEALSSRIAALSMLDLGWQHLGVEMDDDASDSEDVNKLVIECGESAYRSYLSEAAVDSSSNEKLIVLKRLHDHDNRSPKAKADVLVTVHKEVVGKSPIQPHIFTRLAHFLERLSNLPPLRLKPDSEQVELEPADLKAPLQHVTKGPQVNNTSSQSSLKDTRPRMPLPIVDSPKIMSDSTPLRDDPSVFSPQADKVTVLSEEALTEKSVGASESLRKTPVNTDVILPIIMYSIVKTNPVQLVSQLLFIERFRSKRVGGEESYCLINFLAAVEFLEHVDMRALGLGEADRVMRSVSIVAP